MAGEQLERSILESKERDELQAIAAAMSLKPAARTKKSDIIDLILDATGIAANGGSVDAAPSEPRDVDTITDEPIIAPRPRRAPRRTASQTATADAAASSTGMSLDAASEAPARNGASAVEGGQTRHNGSSSDDLGEQTNDEDSQGGDLVAASNGLASIEHQADVGDTLQSYVPQGEENGNGQNGDSGRTQGYRQNQNQGRVQERDGGQGDAANRRGRRRRGRERVGGEQAGAPETPWQGELVPVKGLLDLREEGYGFLRTSGYLPGPKDVYVSVSQARRFALRKGDAIEGGCRPAGASEKYPALVRIDSISGLSPEEARIRPRFEDLTPLFPDEQLRLEMPGEPMNLTSRIVDLISPIGKGQRGLIVSPPKAGKTTIMKQIAHSIEVNNPEVHLIVLLVDERPEEVTDMRRSVKGEVIASTFDRPADEHTAIAELTIERAKRLVELGRDIVIVLDGITRLARAYNIAQPTSGRVMSGGIDSGALYPPKKFFGAARNIEEGGSLTILATALVETGSRMDEVIFEEFKGTGNMELRLDRKLAERRLYPSIDVNGSSTRHEELLFGRSELQQVWKLRRVLNALGSEGNAAAGLELLNDKIRTTKSNDEFLAEIAKAPVPTA
ncbi:MAG TPA: transcription termination factor Rho [Acidimicrobiales bacterium]